MAKAEEKGPENEDYTQDGTVDLNGRPVLRSKTGKWKACSFIVGYEVFERMAYYGIASNLVLYLTNKLHESTVTSSNNVTNWVGTVWMTPILGAYIADAYLGRYWTFVIASAIYLSGMSLLTLAVSVPALRPPSCGPEIKAVDCDKQASPLQKGIFYCALYIIAAGTGGTKPNISTMGADQFDDFEPKERHHKLSFFNWWMFSIFFGTLFSNTFLVYIQDTVGWSVGYGLPTLGLAVSVIVFLFGTPFYRHKVPSGSPFTRMAKVLVAAVRKWKVVVPDDKKKLHELSIEEYSTPGKFRIDYTPSLSLFLSTLMAKAEEKGPENEDYTQDGTVDLMGRPVLRSKTGKWKACSFIVGYEMFERMAFYGIASNLVLYLTKKLHEGTVTSSNNVTNWIGTVWMTPIIGAYIADAYLGRYLTFVIASAIYLSGMGLVTLAVSVPALRPPSCGPEIREGDCNKQASPLQKGIFYCALYIIAVGTGGTKANISTMGADQFDDFEPKERQHKLSFFNWWMFSIFFGGLFSNTFLVYIQDNVGWSVGYGLPTLGLAVSIIGFLFGTPFYRHRVPSGSPFTRMAKVLVAAVRKWKVVVPNDTNELHELSIEEYSTPGKFRIDHTPSLRLLDKAAVKSEETSPWKLCPVTQVEETKQMIKMIPILVATFVPSATLAQVGTLFIKQGTTLERNIGPHFEIPPACLTAFVTIFMLISIVLYDRYFVPAVRKYTKNPRGITILQRLGIGLLMHVVIMIIACLAERKRLSVARENKIYGKNDTVPLSIFILLPQFALMGVADTFVEVTKLEFFYDQAPEGMKSLGTSYYTSSAGIGSFLSSFLLKTVSNITKANGHKGWILDNLNISHIDYYYAFLAILSFLNFLFYLFVTKFYVYNVDRGIQKGVRESYGNSDKQSNESGR